MNRVVLDVAATYALRKDASWLPMPEPVPYTYGFIGKDAEKCAVRMSTAVEKSVKVLRELAPKVWQDVARAMVISDDTSSPAVNAAIYDAVIEVQKTSKKIWAFLLMVLNECRAVDKNPVESRTAISEPLRQLYKQLSDEVDRYVSLQLHTTYKNLSEEVEKFIHQKL